MQARSGPTAALVLFVLDAALLALATGGVVLVAGGGRAFGFSDLIFPAMSMLFLYALGLYRREALVDQGETLGRVPIAAGFGGLISWAVLAGLPARFGAPDAHLLFAASVPCFAAAGLTARLILHLLRRQGAFRRRLLVIGAGRRAWDLAWMLRHEARTLAFDLFFVHGTTMGEPDPRLGADPTARVIHGAKSLLAIVRDLKPDEIVVAPDERRGLAMDGLLACKMAGYPVSEYAQFLEREIGRIDLKRLDVSWLLYAEGFATGTPTRVVKRGMDIAVSGALLLILAPTLLVTALAVKVSDGGPVFYRQDRVTRGGRIFRILKLRTMGVDAERNGAVWAKEADPRVTPVGALLRRIRLDELPQLVNVLCGDMSLVGPRPERPEFTKRLAAKLPLYEERHLVRAGITGWAQANYPYGASLNDARSKLSYDLFYVKNTGILFDLRILLQTLRVIFWPGGAR